MVTYLERTTGFEHATPTLARGAGHLVTCGGGTQMGSDLRIWWSLVPVVSGPFVVSHGTLAGPRFEAESGARPTQGKLV